MQETELHQINALQMQWLKESIARMDEMRQEVSAAEEEIKVLRNDLRIANKSIAELEAENVRLSNNVAFMERYYIPRSSLRRAGKMKFLGLGIGNQDKGFNAAREGV